MGDWKGPVRREILRGYIILTLIVAPATLIIAYKELRGNGWIFIAFTAPILGYFFGMYSYTTWYRYRQVWSFVHRPFRREFDIAEEDLQKALGVASVDCSVIRWLINSSRRTFDLGRVEVVIEEKGEWTDVHVGPLKDSTAGEIEKLKTLVDEALG